MHKFIIFLLLFNSCSNSSEDITKTIEPTTSTSITTFSPDSTSFSQTIIIPNTSTTTTTVPQSTTSSTTSQDTSTPPPSESTNNSSSEIKLPEISITNCPDSNIDQDSYELLWSITAGNFDVDYVRISYWINGEYFSRVYYEKSQLNDTFPFPVADEKIVYSQSLDFNDSDGYETLEVVFSISDESESFFEIEEKCTFYFNNTPLFSTTTSTTTTTVPQSTTTTSTSTTSSTTTTVPETTTTTSTTTTTVPQSTTTTSTTTTSTTTTSTTTTSTTTTSTTTTTVPQSIINVEVTVGIGDSGQSVYFLNGSQETILNVVSGNIYRFNQSDNSNSNHPLRFSASQEGSEYSSNVTSSGLPGNSGSYVEIEITSNTPNKLYLICLNHFGMGGNSEIIKN